MPLLILLCAQASLGYKYVTSLHSCTNNSLLWHVTMLINLLMQVNTNGILSFRSTFTSSFIRTFPFFSSPLIAPYWDNFDLRRGGNLFYRQTSNVTLVQRVQNQLQDILPSANTFPPTRLFIATWERVPGRFQSFRLVCMCVYKLSRAHILYATID